MSHDELAREVLDGLEDERRPFVERAVSDMSFAVPVVASFDMDDLTMDSAAALTPNAVHGAPDVDLTPTAAR
jgi:hypothetical protein